MSQTFPTSHSSTGSCATCADMIQMRDNKVLCGSKKHARFMDIQGATNYVDKLRKYHAIELLTAESIGLICPSWRGG